MIRFSFYFKELIEEDIDWWCKYYASMGSKKMCGSYLRKGYSKLVVIFFLFRPLTLHQDLTFNEFFFC